MVREVRLRELGGPEVLRLEDVELADPGAGEARVRIEAIGLNRSEALYRAGAYPMPPTVPGPMGYEAAGVVTAVGPGVTAVSPGDAVSVLPMYRQGEYGVYAEEAVVPVRALVKRPEGVSPVTGAAVWMAFMTALGIVQFGKASAGDYVLIPAASSSVGIAAIQLCNWVGAFPVAATRTRDKAERLRAEGAHDVIVTGEEDLLAEGRRITGGKGFRIVFDPVGGPGIAKLAESMAQEGVLFIYGSLSGEPTPWPHWQAALKGLSLRGWVASAIWNDPARFAWATDLILTGLREGVLKPVVAREFSLGDIAEAHRYLESNQQVGKVVVRP